MPVLLSPNHLRQERLLAIDDALQVDACREVPEIVVNPPATSATTTPVLSNSSETDPSLLWHRPEHGSPR